MEKYEKFYWLNEDSRKFLSRGYLSDGETPESRIRDIAEAAEKYLGIEGYADQFYTALLRTAC
jgi:ribonucleoside-diphosphate reductase alpha chain